MKVSVDMSDLKVLNDYLSTTQDKIDLTAKTASKDFETLRRSIDPVYRSTKILKDQVLVAQKAFTTGAITQKEYAAAMAQIAAQANHAGIQMNQYGEVVGVNTRKMKRFGAVGMQQVGYQVQDFAVQVQSGTSALVALGQQGSQLLGIFGPAGAIAGMILAIGTGLVGAFLAAKGATDEATESAISYKDIMTQTKDAISQMRLETQMLTQDIETQEEALLRNAISQAKRAEEEAEQFKDRLGILGSLYDPTKGIRIGFGFGFTQSPEELRKSLEARLKELQDTVALNSAAKENKKLEEESAQAEQDRIKFGDQLLKNLTARAQKAVALYGKEGEAKLRAEQNLELLKLENDLVAKGIELTSETAKNARYNLNVAHAMEMQEYQRVAAIKEREQAERDAEKARKEAAEAAKKAHEEYVKSIQDMTNLANGMANSFGDAFMSLVDGTKTAKEAFRDMARSIIKQLFEILVVQQLVGAFDPKTKTATGLAGMIGTALTGTKSIGGPVRAGHTYLVGERGPELFTAPSNGNITPNSNMGGNVVVNQTINVSTGVQQTVRTEIKSLMPQIAEASKAAVADAKRRGGSYGRNFA